MNPIQDETATVAQQGANNAPKTPKATRKANQKKGAPKANKSAKEPKATKKARTSNTKDKPASKKAAKAAGVPREFSKKAIVLDLLRRNAGATMTEIAKTTDWQNHSIRGFLSGQVSKRMGLTVESTKNEAGERVYKVK